VILGNLIFQAEVGAVEGQVSVPSLPRLFAFIGTPFGFPPESSFTFTGIPKMKSAKKKATKNRG
jgi:hypothetical protein